MSENEEPVKVGKSKERNCPLPRELISARSLNAANVRGLGTVFLLSAILFDLTSNMLFRGVPQCSMCHLVPE